MKTIKTIAITAIALVMGLSACNKEEGFDASSDNFNVTLAFKKSPATRADGLLAVSGTKVTIDNGYLCFVSASDYITDVYTISSAATLDKNIQNSALGTTAVTIENVPGSSVKVAMIVNTGTNAALSAPVIGQSIVAYMYKNMDVKDQGDYTLVTATGSAALVATADPQEKTANIQLETKVSRIQIEDLCFDSAIATAKVEGIFINGYYANMQLDGTASSFVKSNIAANYASGSATFPLGLSTFVYDMVGNYFVDSKVEPVNGVWGYNLFTSATPQIIIKFSEILINDQLLSDPQFVTINGFRDGFGKNITSIEGGMIYTISAGDLVIKSEHFSPEPGILPISVNVTVETVEWDETKVFPNL